MATLRMVHRMVPTQPTVVRDGQIIAYGGLTDGHDRDTLIAECMAAVAAGQTHGGAGPVGKWGVDYPVTGTHYLWDYEVCDVSVVRCRDRASADEWASAIGGRVQPYGATRSVGCPGDGMAVSVTEYEVMGTAAAKAVYTRVERETAKMPAGPDRRFRRLSLCHDATQAAAH